LSSPSCYLTRRFRNAPSERIYQGMRIAGVPEG
jgi:hypothetical protein